MEEISGSGQKVRSDPYRAETHTNLLYSLFPCCDLEKTWPDFEELITVLDEWDDFRLACENDSDQFIQSFRKSLIKDLYQVLCDPIGAAQQEHRLDAVKTFLKKAYDDQSTIISFNWDLLLEVVAQDIGLGIAYQKPATENEVCVAKPHGSLNLAELPEQEYEEKKHAINVQPRGMKVEWKDEKTNTLVLRIQNPATDLKGMVYTFGPIVIPPTAKKTYQSPWISYQWHLALDMVRNAEEVVIIGYSLPFTDIRPRLLLQFARFWRGNLIPIKLIDPKDETGWLWRIKRFFKKTETLKQHFEHALGSPVEVVNKKWESIVSDI